MHEVLNIAIIPLSCILSLISPLEYAYIFETWEQEMRKPQKLIFPPQNLIYFQVKFLSGVPV